MILPLQRNSKETVIQHVAIKTHFHAVYGVNVVKDVIRCTFCTSTFVWSLMLSNFTCELISALIFRSIFRSI